MKTGNEKSKNKGKLHKIPQVLGEIINQSLFLENPNNWFQKFASGYNLVQNR